MSLSVYIPICHKCPHRQKVCAGSCPCTLDGVDIIEHAKKGECPDNRFVGICGNCGGKHATASCPIPADFDPADYASDSKGTGPCNC